MSVKHGIHMQWHAMPQKRWIIRLSLPFYPDTLQCTHFSIIKTCVHFILFRSDVGFHFLFIFLNFALVFQRCREACNVFYIIFIRITCLRMCSNIRKRSTEEEEENRNKNKEFIM